MEDCEIISRFEHRDEVALFESKQKYGASCLSIANRILGNPEDAEECVQDTWVQAWNSIPPDKPVHLFAYFHASHAISRLTCCAKRKPPNAAATTVPLHTTNWRSACPAVFGRRTNWIAKQPPRRSAVFCAPFLSAIVIYLFAGIFMCSPYNTLHSATE